MRRRPPISTLFPTRRSSDLSNSQSDKDGASATAYAAKSCSNFQSRQRRRQKEIAMSSPTVAQYLADPAAYDQIPGGFEIEDTLPNIVSALATLNSDSHIIALSAVSGTATITGGVPVSAPSFLLSGAGTALTISENLTL